MHPRLVGEALGPQIVFGMLLVSVLSTAIDRMHAYVSVNLHFVINASVHLIWYCSENGLSSALKYLRATWGGDNSLFRF